MTLNRLLTNFHDAILQSNPDAASYGIKQGRKISPPQQLAIYIDGYRIRLIQAIRSDYPALLGLLGENEFDKLALGYIENNPPSSFNLDRYPHNFANFIASQIDGFSRDLAVLEGAIAEVFMMPESEPLCGSEIAKIPPEEIPNMAFKPRLASKLLEFSYNVSEWLTMAREGTIPQKPSQEISYIYVYRHENNVRREFLGHEEYLVLIQIFSGKSLESSLENTVMLYPECETTIIENIQGWFSKWTIAGFFSVP